MFVHCVRDGKGRGRPHLMTLPGMIGLFGIVVRISSGLRLLTPMMILNCCRRSSSEPARKRFIDSPCARGGGGTNAAAQ